MLDTCTHVDTDVYPDTVPDVTEPVKRLTRPERQQQTRMALLDAAMELFVERGVEATTIEDVVSRAGYTRGAFYSNFSTKDELFLATSRHFLEVLHVAAREPEGAGDGEDPGEAMRSRFARIRGVVDNSGSVFLAEITLYAVRRPELRDAIGDLHREQLPLAIDFARANVERAGIHDIDRATVEELANITQSLTFGLHLFELVDADIHAEQTASTAMRLMMRGLAAERDAGARPKRA